MEVSRLKSLVGNGRIFSVVFTKRTDGSERKMIARTGVKKGVSGGGSAYDPEAKGLLTVYDMQKGGYRMIPAESVTEIRASGQRIKV